VEPVAHFSAKVTGRSTAFWTVPASTAPGSGPRSWWTSATGAFPPWDSDSFYLPLEELRSLDAVALIASSEFKHSVPNAPAVFGASGGSSVTIMPPPSPRGWDSWPIPVPTMITARLRGGAEDRWVLHAANPPATLPHDTVELTVHFERDYSDWWQTTPWRLRGRARPEDAGDAPQWQLANDKNDVRLGLEAGRRYVLEFASAAANGSAFSDIRTARLTVAAAPAAVPRRIVALVAALAIASGALIALTASRVARVALLRVLGRRWSFRVEDCDVIVEAVASPEGGIQLTAERGGAASVRLMLTAQDLVNTEKVEQDRIHNNLREALLPPLADTLQTISLRTPESIFHYPLARWLDGGWALAHNQAQPEARRIGGQVALLRAMHSNPPFRLTRVRYAGIGWPGEPALFVRPELEEIEASFRRLRAEILPQGETPADLVNALCQADVVHVAAHATLTEIALRGGAFTASLLTDEMVRQTRCRLLILSACSAGRTIPGEPSLVWPLIRAGVNVIGSIEPLDDTIARRFFPIVYKRFLPINTADGPNLSEAIARASAEMEQIFGVSSDAPWRNYLNRLVLYGNPTLRLAVFHSPADTRVV
jgi:CHAT domain